MTTGVPRDDLLATQTVLCGNDRTFVEAVLHGSDGIMHLSGFSGYDAKVALRQFIGLGSCLERDMELMRAGDPQSFTIERAGVFFASDKGPYLCHSGQVRR